MGKQAELEPNLTLHPLLFAPFLAEVFEFHRSRRQCCKLGMQIALLGLVTAALWAGLLTLLLLWREDIPSPAWSPSRVPSRPPLRSQGAQPTPWSPIPPSRLPPCPRWPLLMSPPPLSRGHSPCSCLSPISHPLGTSHMIYPRAPSPDGRGKGAGASEEPFLSPSLLSCPDWDTVQNLKHLEETAARNGMEGPGLEKGAKTPGSCPPSATDHYGTWEDWAPVSPKEWRVSLCFLPPWVGEKTHQLF